MINLLEQRPRNDNVHAKVWSLVSNRIADTVEGYVRAHLRSLIAGPIRHQMDSAVYDTICDIIGDLNKYD